MNVPDTLSFATGSDVTTVPAGFRREDLKVWVSEGRLFVRASKDDDTVVEKSWALPKNVLQDGVSAKLDSKNELTVALPKVPEKSKVSHCTRVALTTVKQSDTVAQATEVSDKSGTCHPQHPCVEKALQNRLFLPFVTAKAQSLLSSHIKLLCCLM